MDTDRLRYLIEKYDISFPDTDMDYLHQRLLHGVQHEGHCNCHSSSDIGTPGCSCQVRPHIKALSRYQMNFSLGELLSGVSNQDTV